eukprot:gene12363-biopygen1910
MDISEFRRVTGLQGTAFPFPTAPSYGECEALAAPSGGVIRSSYVFWWEVFPDMRDVYSVADAGILVPPSVPTRRSSSPLTFACQPTDEPFPPNAVSFLVGGALRVAPATPGGIRREIHPGMHFWVERTEYELGGGVRACRLAGQGILARQGKPGSRSAAWQARQGKSISRKLDLASKPGKSGMPDMPGSTERGNFLER